MFSPMLTVLYGVLILQPPHFPYHTPTASRLSTELVNVQPNV